MDLGIAGRKAIVCASSKGLGRACAMALAREGCAVIVNGRDAAVLEATAREIRAATGVEVVSVAGDLDEPAVRAALLEACPAPDILVNNNGGPPPAPFAELTRERILRGLESNMLTPIALIQAVAPGMARRRFGRIVNITSSSVRAPIAGLDVSSGARAGLTAFVAATARALARDNVTINSIQPGAFDTDRLRPGLLKRAAAMGADLGGGARRARGDDSRGTVRRAGGIRRSMRLSRQRARGLRHRAEYSHRRRRLSRRVLKRSDVFGNCAENRRDIRLRGDVRPDQDRLVALSRRRGRVVSLALRAGRACGVAGLARRVPARAAYAAKARPRRALSGGFGRHVRQFRRAVVVAARRRHRLYFRHAAGRRSLGRSDAGRNGALLPLGGGVARLRRRRRHAVRSSGRGSWRVGGGGAGLDRRDGRARRSGRARPSR